MPESEKGITTRLLSLDEATMGFRTNFPSFCEG